MNKNRSTIWTTALVLFAAVGVTGPACSDDKNDEPGAPVEIGGGGDSDAGPNGNAGEGSGGTGNGSNGSVVDLDGGVIILPDGGVVPIGGNTGNGGSSGGGNNGGTGGVVVLPDGAIVDPCPEPLGQDGCFNCPETTDDSEQFLNQCSSSDCSAFDNEERLPHLESDGDLPPLP